MSRGGLELESSEFEVWRSPLARSTSDGSSGVGDPGVRGLESLESSEFEVWSSRVFGCLEVWMFGSLELANRYSTLDRDGSADNSIHNNILIIE